MTREELVARLTGDFGARFADETAAQVLDAGAVELLYALATEPCEGLSAVDRHKLSFRSAYVLERIYFGSRERFGPFADRFCRVDFHACTDPGARRHFGKIMADLLSRLSPCFPSPEISDAIAVTAAAWLVDPAVKVAVRIWAVEVLKECRGRVAWVAEAWDDFLEMQAGASTPGIRARLRNSWKAGG